MSSDSLERSDPSREVPETLSELIAVGADRWPEAPALVVPGHEDVSFRALERHVVETGRALRAAGLGRDDVVATIVGSGASAAATFLAVGASCICAPLNPSYRARELEFYLDDLGARLIAVSEDLETDARRVAASRGIAVAELVSQPATAVERLALERSVGTSPAADEPAGGDRALVLHTSGTTAKPKLVPLAHAGLTGSAAAIATTLELDERDRCLNPMPLFHIHGLVAGLLAPLLSGGSIVCPPSFDAKRFIEWIETLEPTWYTAVPAMHQAILGRLPPADSPGIRHRLRFVRSSSARLPVPVLEALERKLGVPVVEAYGMTEATHQIASNPLPPGRRKPGTVGRAAGPEIAILDEDGAELEVGRVGEVAIRGGSVFAGYADNPEANSSSFVRGWFRTGDLGVLDEDGFLELRGRIKEVINRGGEKLVPGEIDDLLLLHPAVAQAVTFGMPDARLGEEVAAAVVLEKGQDVDERTLQYFVAQTAAPFKVPRRVVVVAEIPKGPTGKVQRIGMFERLGLSAETADGSVDDENREPRTHLESALAAIWEDVLGVAPVGTADDFFALGGDSILGAEAVARIRELIGRPALPLISIVRAPTIARMAEEISTEDDADETLVALRQGGDGTPLFLTHGGDLIVGLPALASRIGGGRPVYGLRPGLEDPADGSLTIEGMAAELVSAVREVHPDGPYVLAGICSGGPIVIEMARLLVAAGQELELLVLIDPRVRASPRLLHIVRRAVFHARHGSLLRTAVSRVQPTVAEFYGQLSSARNSYTLSPLAGVSAAVVTTEDYRVRLSIPVRVWQKALPDGFEARTLPFEHEALMFSPAIDRLASTMDGLIQART